MDFHWISRPRPAFGFGSTRNEVITWTKQVRYVLKQEQLHMVWLGWISLELWNSAGHKVSKVRNREEPLGECASNIFECGCKEFQTFASFAHLHHLHHLHHLQEPEHVFREGDPQPDAELRFWQNRVNASGKQRFDPKQSQIAKNAGSARLHV